MQIDGVVLRSANKGDIPALRAFEQKIIGAERPFDPTLGDGAIRYYDLEQMIGSDGVEMLLACHEDGFIGCGFARIEGAKPYLKHPLQGYLGLMYVAPEHRGKGVNRMIVEGLKRWCLARGITELRLDVYHGNAAAIRAYEKAGFTQHLVEMRMALKPP